MERQGGREGRRSCRLGRQRLRFRPEMSDESEAFWDVASIGLLRLRRSATESWKIYNDNHQRSNKHLQRHGVKAPSALSR